MRFDSDKEAAAYLAAMIDGEGCVQDGQGRHGRETRITNTEPELLAACTEALEQLGIDHYLRWRERDSTRKPIGDIVIGTKDALTRLLALVPIQHPAKRSKLRTAVASYRPKRPSREELEALYAEHGSQRAVALALGVPQSTASLWLRERGVERKPPGRPRVA